MADPSDEEHQELSDWYKFATGQDAGTFEPYAFDAAALNNRLEELAKRLWPELPTDDDVAAVVRPVQWLLTPAGTDGLPLTQDGYLKPAVVSEAVRALEWSYRWPGAANRESQTRPVLLLRQQLQAWKLLRKSKGKLILSLAGRKLHGGGRPLWDYLVKTVAFPADQSTAVVTRIVVHWLLEGPTPSWEEWARIIADTMTVAGVRMEDGGAGAPGRGSGLIPGRALDVGLPAAEDSGAHVQ